MGRLWCTLYGAVFYMFVGGSMKVEERGALQGRAVILFDGRCGLCHGVVRFLIARDRGRRLRYVPQESGLGRELMGLAGLEVPDGGLADGVILVEDALGAGQRVWMRSEAVGRMLTVLGGLWGAVGRVLKWVPRWLREWGYGVVARWRYRVFGQLAACPLPTAEERGLILGGNG